MSLTAPGLEIHDARIRLERFTSCRLTASVPIYGAIGYTDCINVVPFNLGADLLSRLRIYIANDREKLFVTTLPAP